MKIGNGAFIDKAIQTSKHFTMTYIVRLAKVVGG
jgi:hypothetical protein